MKISAKYFSATLLACLAATATVQLKAQVVVALGPSSGGIDLQGGGTFSISTQTNNTNTSRFLWLPGKSALLVGSTMNTPNLSDIGQSSVALGEGAVAQGNNSFAAAGGYALGESSVAFWSTAVGGNSFAAIGGYAQGNGSVAFFGGAYGEGSIAIGGTSDGDYSVALSGAYASGYYSFAGVGGGAYGDYSIALGDGTEARAYSNVAVGTYNLGKKKNGTSPDPVAPAADDPIFEVGIGPGFGSTPRANGLTVFRDGTVRLSKASGGISMGQFN